MTDLVLHIGSIKTASTYIQAVLHENVDRLESAGWLIPDFLGGTHHYLIALPFEPPPPYHLKLGWLDADQVSDLRRDLAQKFAQEVKPGRKWIITSERLSAHLNSDERVEDLIGFLSQYFDRITVVFALRRQDFMLPSVYSQEIKAGTVPDWSLEWFERHDKMDRFDLLGMVRRWSRAVGEENLVCVPYFESDKSKPTVFLEKSLAAMGIDFDQTWKLPDNARAKNRSLSAEGAEFLKTVNPFIPRVMPDSNNNKIRSKMIRRVMEITDGPKMTFPPGPLVEIRQRYADDNQEVVERLGGGDEWQRWLEEPLKAGSAVEGFELTAARTVELMVETAVPNGPVDWGQPGGRPVKAQPANQAKKPSKKRLMTAIKRAVK